MDKSEVKAVVELVIEDMVEALGIPHWRIKVYYRPCDNPNWEAQCERQPDYLRAWLTIDPEHMQDDAHVIRCLRHELLHITLAPFDLFLDCAGNPDGTIDFREQRVWNHAVESTVTNLEKLLHNITEQQLHLLQHLGYPDEEGGGDA